MEERLQKVLAAAGVGSRRECEKIILAGKVTVNGQTVSEMGAKADPEQDVIAVNGHVLPVLQKEYIILYKPRGFTSTRSDPHARKTIMDLLPQQLHHLYPVGRLDVTSEGLLLLTNDGELANRLSHPRYHVEKTYRVTISGHLKPSDVEQLQQGIDLEDGLTQPAGVEEVVYDRRQKKTRLNIILREGRKRQIRRMFEALGLEVLRLVRLRIGPLEVGDLRPGQWRKINREELQQLRSVARRIIPQKEAS